MNDPGQQATARFLRPVRLAFEMLVLGVAGVGAYLLRSWLPIGRGPLFPPEAYLPLAAIAVPIWMLALIAAHREDPRPPASFMSHWHEAVTATLYAGLAMSVALYFSRAFWVSRLLVILSLVLACCMLGTLRCLAVLGHRWWRRTRRYSRRAALIGTSHALERLARKLADRPDSRIEVVARVEAPDAAATTDIDDAPEAPPDVRGLAAQLDALIVDDIFVVLPMRSLSGLGHLLREATTRGVSIRFVAALDSLEPARMKVGLLDDWPLLTLTTEPDRPAELLLKRALDTYLSATLLLAFAPVMLTIWLALRITSYESPIFRQVRLGRNGRPFVLYKFRTMTTYPGFAADRLRALNVMSGPVFKAPADPRVTVIGRRLRRWSLDELPQLFNVLKGEMSLVGPRPPLPEEVSDYKPWQRRRLAMRPGITGPWQVAGRSCVDFETWMRLDLEYVDNWSFARDVAILARTVPAVLSGRGAF